MTPENVIILGKLALLLGEQHRATFHADGKRPETVTTHTFMLGLVVYEAARWWWAEWYTNPSKAAPPSPKHAMALAQVHDLAEALCGDTNTLNITAADAEAKAAREAAAGEDLRDMLAPFPFTLRLLQEYEAQRTTEARMVRYLDKALPKITHLLNGCAAVKAQGITPEDLHRLHVEQFAKLAAEYPDIHAVFGPLLQSLMYQSVAAYGEGPTP